MMSRPAAGGLPRGGARRAGTSYFRWMFCVGRGGPRRRCRRRQGKGRDVHRLSWRRRYLADGEHAIARRPARRVHSVAAGFLSRRHPQERADAAVIEQLNNEDIRNLGAYFASLTSPKGKQDDNPDLSRKGAQAAADRGCASCHGDFSGSKAVPRVAGQRQDYLLKALHDYKSGVRSGGMPDDGERCPFPQRRGNRGAGALPRASVTCCRPALCRR